MLGKKITVTVAQPEVQLAGEGRKVLYKGSVALGDHSSPKPVYLISYGDPKPERRPPSSRWCRQRGRSSLWRRRKTQYITRRRSDPSLKRAEGRPPERVSCLYEKSCGAVVYRWRAGRSAFWW